MCDGTSDPRDGKSRTLEKATKDAARARRDDLLEAGFAADGPTLIEALPTVGKSYGVIKWAAESGKPVSVFTERHELYDQYEEWATDDFDLTACQLPVFHQDCPTVEQRNTESQFEGSVIRPISEEKEVDESWRETVLQKYQQGVSGRELHNRATTYFDGELPCQEGGSCPYMEALNQDLDDIDVLIGNFRQVFAEQYQKGRYVVFDEFPKESFIQEFSSSLVSNTVSDYVSYNSKLPFDNWQQVLEYKHKQNRDSEVSEWLENKSHDRSTRPLYRGAGAQIDAHGPLLTEIGLRFERLDNGWRRADLGEGRIAVRSPKDTKVSLLDPPPVEEAEGVVALDGTPCVEMWKLLLGENLTHHAVFTKEQKREYIREFLELRLIQTSNTTKPYHSGDNVTPGGDMAYIEAVGNREEREPCIISSHAAVKEYEERDVEALVDSTEHYNNLKGSGQFGTDRLGIIIGCPQPSDNKIKLWGALAGHSITRRKYENGQPTKGVDLDFGSFGNLVLEDLRDNEVLQAAMRFGREETDGECGATVYIHTAAIPHWVQPETDIPNIHPWDKDGGIKTVIRAIKNRDDWRTGEWKKSDLIETIDDLTSRRVGQILKDVLLEERYIESRRGGRGNARIWSNVSLEDVGNHGLVEW